MPLLFGGFQGLMPLLGYWVGGLFADLVHRYAGIVTLVVLGYIGAKMLFDGLRGRKRGRCGRHADLEGAAVSGNCHEH